MLSPIEFKKLGCPPQLPFTYNHKNSVLRMQSEFHVLANLGIYLVLGTYKIIDIMHSIWHGLLHAFNPILFILPQLSIHMKIGHCE